jgi:hypothetical protein
MTRWGMPGTGRWMRWRGRAAVASVLALGLFAGGCSSNTATTGAPATSSGLSSITDFFSGSSAKAPQPVAGGPANVVCPPVDVRRGASTLTIGSNGEKSSAMMLKYQGSFAREARECSVVDGNMVMRVGVEGRLVVGPSGGPGQVNVPLRIAVVQETPGGSRMITTKFVVVPVAISDANGNNLFTHIEDGITFPLPSPTSQVDDYIVYIGFDPVTAEGQTKPAAPPPKPKRSTNPSTSAN